MTRKQFYNDIKPPAIKKWKGGYEQTQKTFPEWWDKVGKEPCSFYDVSTHERNSMCGICPFKDKGYSYMVEWDDIGKLMVLRRHGFFPDYKKTISKSTFAKVQSLCKQLLQKIKDVEWKDEYKKINI